MLIIAQERAKVEDQPENPFIHFISDQNIAIIPSYELESGVTIHNAPIAYKTFGTLSPEADNAMVICHALTGSADVGDWWGPLLGGPGEPGKEARAFDMSRFFIVCMNSLGSPYGSASPVTRKDGNPDNEHYGPEFPLTTIRDDVNMFRLLLDDLGVKKIAAVIGGSMGGMLVLEFAYFGKDYVRTIVPIATSAKYSAWGISWGEAQRQSIYSDPKYEDGYYAFDDPPSTGLGAARMAALLTYRSRDSFEARFGRKPPGKHAGRNSPTSANEHFDIHNEGHRNVGSPRPSRNGSNVDLSASTESLPVINITDPQFSGATEIPTPVQQSKKRLATYYSAQSYLRYQGQKFIKRFDANCYISITRKLDTHDVSRGRTDDDYDTTTDAVKAALSLIQQPTLVLGIESDGLFTYAEQQELAAAIPNAQLKTIDSPEGHDAFLLEFKQVNTLILEFLKQVVPDIMSRQPVNWPPQEREAKAAKASTVGEAEVEDITAW